MKPDNLPPTASGQPVQDANVFVIGAGFSVEGQVRGQGTVLVSGIVQGNVTADVVKLTEAARITGHVECAQLDVAGRIDGSFTTLDVVVRATGTVAGQAGLVSRGTCVVAGQLQGSLQAQQLKVEVSGQVQGQVRAQQMDVLGRVQGEVEASDLVIRHSGIVDGTVAYGQLSSEHGSEITGQLQRLQRQGGAAPQVRPAMAQKPLAESTVYVQLPASMRQRFREHPDEVELTLVDGQGLPAWVRLDRENARLVLDKTEIDKLQARGESVTLRLLSGGETLVFKLPPGSP